MIRFFKFAAIALLSVKTMCCRSNENQIDPESMLSINFQITQFEIYEDMEVEVFNERFSEIMTLNQDALKSESVLMHITLTEFAMGNYEGYGFTTRQRNRWSFHVYPSNRNFTVQDFDTRATKEFESIYEILLWIEEHMNFYLQGVDLRSVLSRDE